MRQVGLNYRAIIGAFLGGSVVFLGTILVGQVDAGMDSATLAASMGTCAWFGAFVGVFGFKKGSQLWNDTLDAIDDAFST